MMLWAGFPILILIVVALVMTGRAGSVWVAGRHHPSPVDGAIIALAQVIVVSQLLGLAGCLTPLNLLIAHTCVTAAIRFILRSTLSKRTAIPYQEAARIAPASTLLNILDRLIILLPFVAGAAALINAAHHAPGGTDVWTYHLAFPAEWSVWHDLRCSVQNIGDPGPPFYPHHGGLIAHLLMAPLHSDIFARFHQVPMWIAGLFALSAGITATGLSRRSAWTATALAGLMPLVASWVPLAFADISLAGAIALVFYAAARINQSSTYRHACILGLATGLATGFKAYGLYYAVPLVVWGLVRLLRNRTSGRITTLAFWVAGATLTGSFWHLRNWILNGNPLFPYQAELNGMILFRGLYSRSIALQHGFHQFNFMQQFTIPELWKTLSAPGFLLVIGLLISLLYMLRRQHFQAIIVIPLIMGIQFLYLPYRHHPRLLLPTLWLCAPATAFLLDALRRRSKSPGPYSAITIICLLTVLISVTPYVVFSAWVVIPVAAVLASAPELGRRWKVSPLRRQGGAGAGIKRRIFAGALVICLLFPWICTEYERHKWIDHGSELGEIAIWLVELNADRPHMQIAFAGFNTPYPLCGLFLGNTVRYLSRDGDADASWTGDRPYRPLAEPDAGAWQRLVDEAGIDVIVIATIPGDPLPPEYFRVREMHYFELGYLTSRYQAWTRKQ